ncbi:aspartate/glutamate racemase family protein [Gudongella oleilytica]|uniref:aspartate/glutamate racemase family protein n=1 Tax=Gudongella oleilytica TaxID=1582259 RepID=UPI002A365BA7|nr:aspartate/glutamate racemase family protein [Gudongella oleilytica]MDY0257290.1 aspartate/glutamate racemase family protein [Gudongella oleilytica]
MDRSGIGIIAGTYVDTQMGVDFFAAKGIAAKGYPVSSSPEEQSKLQILSPNELAEDIRKLVRRIKDEGRDTVIVYCNSLSTAVDFQAISREEEVRIITPLTAYKSIASKYNFVGLLTANNQTSSGIEKIMLGVNPDIDVVGIALLPVVILIEANLPAKAIIEKFGLNHIVQFFNTIGVDAIILGCTHFPYLSAELNKLTKLPILDPVETMFQML